MSCTHGAPAVRSPDAATTWVHRGDDLRRSLLLWSPSEVVAVAFAYTTGFALLSAAFAGARRTTTPSWLLLCFDAAATSLIVILAGSAVFLMAGFHRIGELRRALLPAVGDDLHRQPIATNDDGPYRDVYVASAVMRHFHRPECAAAAGKPVSAHELDVHRSVGRVPCELCRPIEGWP